MAIIKSFTSLEQSKKLAEILPLESADMCCFQNPNGDINYYGFPFLQGNKASNPIPCWSLAALLSVLPKKYYPIKDHSTYLILSKPKNKWCVLYWDPTGMQDGEQTLGDNPVDACYEMILRLHELKIM